MDDNAQTEEPTNSVSTGLPINGAPIDPNMQQAAAPEEEAPLMITQEDVEKVTGNTQATQTPQVEVISPSTTPSPTLEPTVQQPTVPHVEPVVNAPAPAAPMAPKVEQIAPVVTAPVTPPPSVVAPAQTPSEQTHKVPINNNAMNAPTKPDPLSGIYPKPLPQGEVAPQQNNIFDEPKNEIEQSVIGIIGEVIGSTGIIMLLIMLASPFYRDFLESSLYQAIATVGFLAGFVLLAFGFLLSLFLKGKALLKIMFFIFLLISTVMYFGLNTSGTLADFINDYAVTVLDFYR